MATGTVLIVDDDPSITALIETALEEEGYRVMASVGAGALSVAHDQQPDLILLDIMMPGMDGIEVSQRLRADAATAAIPIVAMSAHSRLQATTSVMPVNDRLAKPFELAQLYDTVARWVHHA